MRLPAGNALIAPKTADHLHVRCELRYHGEWGVEAQILENDWLRIGRRFDTRAAAVQRAEEERADLEKEPC